MAAEILAKRHAQAVFQIALERGELEKWRSDLNTLAEALRDPAVLAVLDNPRIRIEQKRQIIDRALPQAQGLLRNLIYLLIARRRMRILPHLAEEYGRLVDRKEGIEHAEVITAEPIDEGIKGKILEHLTQLSGTKIVVRTKVDPNILGGFVARVGDKLVDGSIRTRLEKLKKELAQAG